MSERPWGESRASRRASARARAASPQTRDRSRCCACSDGGCTRQIGMWHGWQSSFSAVCVTTAAMGLSGAQCHGLVGPKMPIVGVPSAAATCSRPESFDTATFAAASARIALRRSVPVRSRVSRCGIADDARERRLGGAAEHPDVRALMNQAAARDPRRPPPGQRFDGPTAPGASATVGRPLSGRPCRSRQPAASPAGTLSSGSGHSAGGAAPGEARARRTGRSCAAACARRSADR